MVIVVHNTQYYVTYIFDSFCRDERQIILKVNYAHIYSGVWHVFEGKIMCMYVYVPHARCERRPKYRSHERARARACVTEEVTPLHAQRTRRPAQPSPSCLAFCEAKKMGLLEALQLKKKKPTEDTIYEVYP